MTWIPTSSTTAHSSTAISASSRQQIHLISEVENPDIDRYRSLSPLTGWLRVPAFPEASALASSQGAILRRITDSGYTAGTGQNGRAVNPVDSGCHRVATGDFNGRAHPRNRGSCSRSSKSKFSVIFRCSSGGRSSKSRRFVASISEKSSFKCASLNSL